MVCPKCNATNSNNAATCKRCGQRLNRQAPTPQQQSSRRMSANSEKKYIIVGTATLLALVLFIIGGILALSCMCGNCSACADEADSQYINESVDGEWQGEESTDIIDGAADGADTTDTVTNQAADTVTDTAQ